MGFGNHKLWLTSERWIFMSKLIMLALPMMFCVLASYNMLRVRKVQVRSIYPLRVSVDSMLSSGAEFFVRKLNDFLAVKW